MSLNLMTNIMRKINPKFSDIDSFKYSILISLHYYDISFHPKKIDFLFHLDEVIFSFNE